jgi:hypothetical protein
MGDKPVAELLDMKVLRCWLTNSVAWGIFTEMFTAARLVIKFLAFMEADVRNGVHKNPLLDPGL